MEAIISRPQNCNKVILELPQGLYLNIKNCFLHPIEARNNPKFCASVSRQKSSQEYQLDKCSYCAHHATTKTIKQLHKEESANN